MEGYELWFETVMELLAHDVDAALQVIQTTVSRGPVLVAGPLGDLDAEEVLTLARLMLDTGNDQEAEGLVHTLVIAELQAEVAAA